MFSVVCTITRQIASPVARSRSPTLILGVLMSTDIKSLLASKHVGFMGSGQMAKAMVNGFLSAGVLKGSQVTMSDIINPQDAQLFASIQKMKDSFGVEYTQDNAVMAKKSDIIFACVKPNLLEGLLSQIAGHLENKLIISVAAGKMLEQIADVCPDSTRVIRVMPNTPCLVQAGTAIFSTGKTATAEDVDVTKLLCSGIFQVFEAVPEYMISAASGISGCGPAYVFLIAEALADGGVRMGIPWPIAYKLAVNTLQGSAKMMQVTGEHPGKLRNDVCSPGGATIAGVHALEDGGLRSTLMNAVRAATIRSDEMK